MQRAVKKRMAPTVPHGVYARERTKELVFAGEGERRVAERIYDIGSTLAAIKYNLESTRTKVEEGSATPGEITEILAMVKVLNEEVRSVATDMCPWILDDLGIVATISWFCRKFESTHKGIRIEKHITVQEEEIPENLKTVIFRVVQESFHNIARYSKADLFTLSLRRRDAFLDLSVADNGAEFEPSPTTSRQNRREGFGLTAIKERVELSGGSFSFEPVAERGTRIKATWSD